MSQEIQVILKVASDEKSGIQGSECSITINQDATLKDILIQDFKKDRWIKCSGISIHKDYIGFVFVFNMKQIGSESLDKKLNNLKVENGSKLFVVFAKDNNRQGIIKFSDFEEDNEKKQTKSEKKKCNRNTGENYNSPLLNHVTNNFKIKDKQVNKNKKSNIKRRSKLRIILSVFDMLLLIAFILAIYFHVTIGISVALFITFLILTTVVVNWNDIVSKNYQGIPCGFFSCCSKSENQYLENRERSIFMEDNYNYKITGGFHIESK